MFQTGDKGKLWADESVLKPDCGDRLHNYLNVLNSSRKEREKAYGDHLFWGGKKS